jgi:hypothetical protein
MKTDPNMRTVNPAVAETAGAPELTRRGFITKLAMAGGLLATASTTTSLLAGCGGGGGGNNTVPQIGSTLTGLVRNANTNAPIPGATVTVVSDDNKTTTTAGNGTFLTSLKTGPDKTVIVSAPGYLPMTFFHVAPAAGATALVAQLIPITSAITVTPGVPTGTTAPASPATGGVPAPVLTLPSGSVSSSFTVTVSSGTALAPGEWKVPAGTPVAFPLSPEVVLSFTGNPSSGNVPADATLDIPSYIPLPIGSEIDVQVTTSSDVVGGPFVPGTVVSSNVVRVKLADVIAAIGRGRSGGRDDLTVYVSIYKITINAPTINETVGGTTQMNYTKCGVTTDSTVNVATPNNLLHTETLTENGVGTVPVPAGMAYSILQAILGQDFNKVTTDVPVKGFSYGTISATAHHETFSGTGPVQIRREGAYIPYGSITISGSWDSYSFIVNGNVCTGGGGNTP